jgi:hypothetical protein
MNTPSIRDLELLNHRTHSGKSEMRSILETGFQIDPLLVDWILDTVSEQNRKIQDMASLQSQVECSCCGANAVGNNAAWLCEECASQNVGKTH